MSFGGAYFLDELIKGIEYKSVLDGIGSRNPDTMYSLLLYTLLNHRPDCDASIWYRFSYVRLLYPQVNPGSQRIPDFYTSFGSDRNRRAFFLRHTEYLHEVTDDDCAMIIDCTGGQNACRLPLAKVSRPGNAGNMEFRLVLVIQLSPGLPVYYEIIPGNVVDSAAMDRIIRLMAMYGFQISHSPGDAAYGCPANAPGAIIFESDLIMRLNPAYDRYKKAVEDHQQEFAASSLAAERDRIYRNRMVRVVKIPMVIGTDEQGTELQGFLYLCRDLQARDDRADHKRGCHGKDPGDEKSILAAVRKPGMFAVVSSEDLDKEDLIPRYCMRQEIDQFFDFARNDGKRMPGWNPKRETLQGYMLMSFIVTFLLIVIQNRMNPNFFLCIGLHSLRSAKNDIGKPLSTRIIWGLSFGN